MYVKFILTLTWSELLTILTIQICHIQIINKMIACLSAKVTTKFNLKRPKSLGSMLTYGQSYVNQIFTHYIAISYIWNINYTRTKFPAIVDSFYCMKLPLVWVSQKRVGCGD